MQIITDSLFLIGKSHKVCQDYTLSGHIEGIGHYAIVCDGCSSSKDTDIGARLLAISARESLAIFNTDYKTFGFSVIMKADQLRYSLGLDRSCLDATLLVTLCNDKGIYTYVYGDGYLIEKEGEYTRLTEYKFESGAPYYLSYWIDKGRDDGYRQKFGNGKLLETDWCNRELTDAWPAKLYNEPIVITSDSFIDALILSSDGLDSFSGTQGPYLKANDVYEPFIAFKNTNGEYLKRRVIAHCKDLDKMFDAYHQDDLGMASMIFKEDV